MELMTLAEVAALLKTPPATLRWWRHAGHGPKSFKVGARVMYRRQDVDQWLDAQYAQTSA